MVANQSVYMFSSQLNKISLDNVSSIIETLDLVTQNFIVHLPLIFTMLGLIGFIGNTFTFLQRSLRLNTCCIYSLCGSLADIITLFVNLFPNSFNRTVGNLILTTEISFLCKVRLFLFAFLPQLSMNFLILSLIDRYTCTCSITSPMRHFRRLKLVPWLILSTISLTCLISIYTPILNDILPNIGCTSTQLKLNSTLYILINGLITPLAMLLYVLLTYRNVRRSHRRINLTMNRQQHRFRNQFIRMVFTQVFGTAFFSLPWICTYLYFLTIQYTIQTNEHISIVYFLLSLTNNLYYVSNVKSFYLSTLTSRRFRVTLIEALSKLFHV